MKAAKIGGDVWIYMADGTAHNLRYCVNQKERANQLRGERHVRLFFWDGSRVDCPYGVSITELRKLLREAV